MPDYEAIPFSKLPVVSKRSLFPQMLPALWDALCSMPHGDLSESNILISQKQNIFHIMAL
jgi:serine/threonine-protein kinase RIO1